MQSMDLSAQTYWVPDSNALQYLTYGAAASEVEVHLLTGATKILQTDIIYDCGRSLNPAVDLGQSPTLNGENWKKITCNIEIEREQNNPIWPLSAESMNETMPS
eukprot:Gb_10652 [translate_table: standard]